MQKSSGSGPSRRKETYQKGRYAEIYLARILMRYGYAVLRAPASGAKAKRLPYPDLLAFKNGRILIFEVKRRSRRQAVYLSEDQYSTLMFWKSKGAEVYVAVRYDVEGPDFLLVPIDCAEEVGDSAPKYRLSVDRVLECGKRVQEVA